MAKRTVTVADQYRVLFVGEFDDAGAYEIALDRLAFEAKGGLKLVISAPAPVVASIVQKAA